MNALEEFSGQIEQRLAGTVVGLRELIAAVVICVVARGHILVEGPPGLGKTLLGKSLARTLAGRFSRIQGTADLMPADVTGVHIFDETARKFALRPGPIFTEVLLIDEINRTGPRTQSALLEAMEERQVSIDRQTYRLPAEFVVIATQNPHEFEGTFPLPESQLDRFMMRVDVTYPAADDERSVLERYGTVAAATAAAGASAVAAVDAPLLAAARACADAVHVSAQLRDYALALAQASREHPQIALGLSTRGVLALLRAARVAAGLRGADFVAPDDLKRVASWVTAHRLTLTPEALLEGRTGRELVRTLLERVPVPR